MSVRREIGAVDKRESAFTDTTEDPTLGSFLTELVGNCNLVEMRRRPSLTCSALMRRKIGPRCRDNTEHRQLPKVWMQLKG